MSKTDPRRSAVATLAQILDIVNDKLCVRHRKHWSVRLVQKNGDMFTRTKSEYDWNELPVHKQNRRKPKSKPGSLGEEILFAGEEQHVYNSLWMDGSKPTGTLRERAAKLQTQAMQYGPYVGTQFHLSAAHAFISLKCKGQPRSKSKKGKQPVKRSSASVATVNSKPATTSAPRKKKRMRSPRRESLKQVFDHEVDVAVTTGAEKDNAQARLITDLLSSCDRDVTRMVAKNMNILPEANTARVTCGTAGFQRGLSKLVTVTGVSKEKYNKIARPVVQEMTGCLVGDDVAEDLVCGQRKLDAIALEERKDNRVRFFTPCETPAEAPSCLVVDEVPYMFCVCMVCCVRDMLSLILSVCDMLSLCVCVVFCVCVCMCVCMCVV